MFAVITLEKENGKSRYIRRRKCRIEAANAAVIGGAPFRHIKIFAGKKGIDWKAVECAAGCALKSIVLQNGIDLPSNSYLKKFVPDTLPLLLMLNTAAARLDKGESAKKRTMLIEDKNAVLPPYIHRVVNCAYKIKIATDYPEKYFTMCADLLENYGASPIICGSTLKNEKFDVFIGEKTNEQAKYVFSTDLIGTEGFELNVSEEILKLCPNGVDLFLFLCAMFECGGVSLIGNMTLE